MTPLQRVIDYPARDMTITVETGIRVAQLQQLLASERQRLAVDIAQPGLATIGGAIVTNTI
jgi:glycolate oxidase FAD binding subunit